MSQTKQDRPESRGGLFKALLIVLVLLVAWNFVAPALGIVVGAAGGAMSVVLTTIAILFAAMVLSFVWVGMAAIAVGIVAVIWVAVAIVLFPVLLPFLLPIAIVVLVVRLWFGRKG